MNLSLLIFSVLGLFLAVLNFILFYLAFVVNANNKSASASPSSSAPGLGIIVLYVAIPCAILATIIPIIIFLITQQDIFAVFSLVVASIAIYKLFDSFNS